MNEKLNIAKDTLRAARQESEAYFNDGQRINELLWYHVAQDLPGEIGIHLFQADMDSLGIKNFIRIYKEGLSELAHRIETDPTLTDIKQITAWSHIVYSNPGLLRLLGFEPTGEQDKKRKEALAISSRADFLERYGSKNEHPDAEAVDMLES
ncbi:MAG TPA: hypothetical protein VN495_02615 [Candidatus Paceibacterota bacterium]|nr:hypothetical protein [Candidatus Paceibacterota bacterium]